MCDFDFTEILKNRFHIPISLHAIQRYVERIIKKPIKISEIYDNGRGFYNDKFDDIMIAYDDIINTVKKGSTRQNKSSIYYESDNFCVVYDKNDKHIATCYMEYDP